MKVLLVHRYFWPDTPPYGHMLRDIAARLAADGHDVEVFSTQPSYQDDVSIPAGPSRDEAGGVRIHRIQMPPEQKSQRIRRSLNMLYFSIRVFTKVVSTRPDTVMISTSPPILGALSVVLAARLTRSKIVYHCMDIHPEVSLVLRSQDQGRAAVQHRALVAVDRYVCRRATRVVVLSEDMKRSLLRRGPLRDTPILVLNNFEVADRTANSRDLRPRDPSPGAPPLRAVFAGNLGRFQGLDTVTGAVRQLAQDDPVEVVLIGDGVLANALRSDLGGLRVRFTGYLPVGRTRALVAQCDVGLVTLARGVIRYAYPSKTMTYLSEGVPIVAAIEDDSELAQTLRASGAGWSVQPGDATGLAALLLTLAADPALVASARERAAALWRERFSSERALDAWSRVFAALAQSS